jgi:hypothetical protein
MDRKCPDPCSERFFDPAGVGVRQFILFDEPPMRPYGGVIARSQVVKLGKKSIARCGGCLGLQFRLSGIVL